MSDKLTLEDIQEFLTVKSAEYRRLKAINADLLEALQIALKRLNRLNTETDGGKNDQRFWINYAENAISKATNEE